MEAWAAVESLEESKAVTLLDLPIECVGCILADLDTKERARFFSLSRALWRLGKQPGTPFFNNVTLQLLRPGQAPQLARWLRGRKSSILVLRLHEWSTENFPTPQASLVLLALAGGALEELEWGPCRPAEIVLEALHLPRLRRLHLTVTEGTSLEAGSRSLVVTPAFSTQACLEELRIEPVWEVVTFQKGSLPPSLTSLCVDLNEGCLPPALTSLAGSLRHLRLGLPKLWPLATGLEELRGLTRLELWRGALYDQLSYLTALVELELWSPFGVVADSHFERLRPLALLTRLHLHNARLQGYALPWELGKLAPLRELAIAPWPFVGSSALDAGGRLTNLTRLVLPGAQQHELPAALGGLHELVEVDLGQWRRRAHG